MNINYIVSYIKKEINLLNPAQKTYGFKMTLCLLVCLFSAFLEIFVFLFDQNTSSPLLACFFILAALGLIVYFYNKELYNRMKFYQNCPMIVETSRYVDKVSIPDINVNALSTLPNVLKAHTKLPDYYKEYILTNHPLLRKIPDQFNTDAPKITFVEPGQCYVKYQVVFFDNQLELEYLLMHINIRYYSAMKEILDHGKGSYVILKEVGVLSNEQEDSNETKEPNSPAEQAADAYREKARASK